MFPLNFFACVMMVAALCAADDATYYNPMSSSSYARVQYANNNNSVIRRLGAHRDPTIQYVNFDDLYNKYNVKSNYGLKNDAVAVPNDEGRRKFDADTNGNEDEFTTTAKTLNWEDAPDLTNGWTIEKQQPTTTPAVSQPPRNSFVEKQSMGSTNKGIDYVYAYSNVYNAYNEHDNFPKRNNVVKQKSTTTTAQPPARVNSYADGPGMGTAEYAHYSNMGESETQTSSVAPPVVMEASWTDQQLPSTFSSTKPIKPTQETVRVKESAPSVKSVPPFEQQQQPPQQQPQAPTAAAQIKRNGNGVQSDWRPFSGPTSAVSASTQPMMNTDATEGTLFYADAQNQNLRNKNKQQIPFENVPVFLLDQEQNAGRPQMMAETGSTNVVFPSPMENEINRGDAPQFPSLQSSASISVSGFNGNERPPNNNNIQRFPQNGGNRFERPVQQSLVIPSAPSNNDRPMNFQQANRPQFFPQQQQQQQQQRPPSWSPDRPNNNGNRRPPPFQVRNPPPQRPTERPQMPSGPVGLPPQLQPNQGRPDQDHLTIRLPLPKPGVGLGSSPQNPLPGPPIFLNPSAHNNNDRVDGPQTQNPVGPFESNFNQIQSGGPNFPNQFGPPPNRFPPNFRPPPQQFRPPFMGPPPSTTTATSLIKSFFSKIFPFSARSLDGDEDVPIVDIDSVDYNQTTSAPDTTQYEDQISVTDIYNATSL